MTEDKHGLTKDEIARKEVRYMIKKGLLTGVVLLIFALVSNWFSGVLFPQLSAEYQNPNMFRPWQDPLMMAYFLYPFIFALTGYYLWEKLKKPKAMEFTKTYFIVATIPGMFITYTSFKVSSIMVLMWTISGLLQAYIAGWIFSKMK